MHSYIANNYYSVIKGRGSFDQCPLQLGNQLYNILISVSVKILGDTKSIYPQFDLNEADIHYTMQLC